MIENDKYITFIGRWNILSQKDKEKIRFLLVKNKNILIQVCEETVIDNKNISTEKIIENLKKEFQYEIEIEQLKIIIIPKIESIHYEEGYFSQFRMHMISLIKTLSWRVIGTFDTVIVTWIVSGDPLTGISIGAIQFVTDLILYYIHEIIWEKYIKEECECKCKCLYFSSTTVML